MRRTTFAPVLRVVILDDSPLACEGMAYLLSRDLRGHVTANDPTALRTLLSPQPHTPATLHTTPGKARRPTPLPKAPDIVLVNTDYVSPLIATLRHLLPTALTLCHWHVDGFL